MRSPHPGARRSRPLLPGLVPDQNAPGLDKKTSATSCGEGAHYVALTQLVEVGVAQALPEGCYHSGVELKSWTGGNAGHPPRSSAAKTDDAKPTERGCTPEGPYICPRRCSCENPAATSLKGR